MQAQLVSRTRQQQFYGRAGCNARRYKVSIRIGRRWKESVTMVTMRLCQRVEQSVDQPRLCHRARKWFQMEKVKPGVTGHAEHTGWKLRKGSSAGADVHGGGGRKR